MAISRPVLVFGAGVQGCRAEARAFAERLNIPVVTTWGACDLLPSLHPLNIGGFGTHGTRAANFTVQNADYLLCIGTRLDTKATGTPTASFARGAQIIMVDIDRTELAKMERIGLSVQGIHKSASEFFLANFLGREITYGDFSPWLAHCQDWKRRHPPVVPDAIKYISAMAQPGEIIVSDTGCALAWMMQGFQFKEGQRFLHPFNFTPMGYALPAAIGAHYATGKDVTVVTGDGSIMMNVGELATIGRKGIPISIYLLNNQGHAMCRQSEREWFDSVYAATSVEHLSFPQDFGTLAHAMGVRKFMEFKIDPDADVVPKVKSGHPNEDAAPYLSREELQREMLIPLYEP